MNTSKRNYNGWILCPSKTFPGKFYYFNVLNGEAAWSLNEVETKSMMKNHPIHQVTDRWHSYPEPDSPPVEDGLNTMHWQALNRNEYDINRQAFPNNHTSQVFGQVRFPKYTSNVDTYGPHMMWAPVSRQAPMMVADRQMFDQGYQTWTPESGTHNSDLQKHYVMVENPIINTQHQMFNNYNTFRDPSTPFKNQWRNSNRAEIGHGNIFAPKQNKTQLRNFDQTINKQQVFAQKNDNHNSTFGTRRTIAQNTGPIFKRIRTLSEPQENLNKEFIPNNNQQVDELGFPEIPQFSPQKSMPMQTLRPKNQNNQFNSSKTFVRMTEENSEEITNFSPKKTVQFPMRFSRQKSFENLKKHDSHCFEMSTFRPQKKLQFHTAPKSQIDQFNELNGSKSFENLTELNDCTAFKKSNFSPQKKVLFPNLSRNIVFQNQNLNGSKSFEKPTETEAFSDMPNASFGPNIKMQLFSTLKQRQIHEKSKSTELNSECYEIPMFDSRKNLQTSTQKTKLTKENTSILADSTGLEMTEPSVQKMLSNSTKSTKEIVEKKSSNLPTNLDTNDLRFMLLERKRKVVESDDKNNGNYFKAGKKIPTSYSKMQVRDTDSSPRKRVTFNLGVESDGDSNIAVNNDVCEDMDVEADTIDDVISIDTLRNLAHPAMETEHWYIVVDTESLLVDFEFIDSFVQTDKKCRLLIPYAVKSEIETMSKGDCRGRHNVMAARQLSRRLAMLPAYITVQSATDAALASTHESILSCCLEAVNSNYHVVLITNNSELYDNAKFINLNCYKLDVIKDGAAVKKPEVTFDLQRIKKGHKSGILAKESDNNLVLQVSNNFSTASVKENDSFPVNCFKKGLFDANNIDSNEQCGLFPQNDHNLNKSKSIFLPKNLMRPNQKRVLHDDNDTSVTSEISRDIQNLKLTSDNFTRGPKNQEITSNVHRDPRIAEKDSFFEKEKTSRKEKVSEKEKISEKKENTFQRESFLPVPKDSDQIITRSRMKLRSINGYTLDDHLKRFHVRNSSVEKRLKTRIDEWLCCFTQIMENALSSILQNNCSTFPNNLLPPWVLPDAADCLMLVYGDHPTVKIIVEKFTTLLHNFNANRGNQKRRVTVPNEFMKILGCATLLVTVLKGILPDSLDVLDAEESLNSLLQTIEDTSTAAEFPKAVPTPQIRGDVNDEYKRNYVKQPLEVEQYLNKHYPDWQSHTETLDGDFNNKINQLKENQKHLMKVVRTSGKNLNLLKLHCAKAMTLQPKELTADSNTYSTDLRNDENVDNIDKGQKITKINIKNTDNVMSIKFDKFQTSKDNVDDSMDNDLISSFVENGNDKIENDINRKLIKELDHFSSLSKVKYVDVEKRQKVDMEVLSMINQMVSGEVASKFDDENFLKPNNRIDNEKNVADSTQIVCTGLEHSKSFDKDGSKENNPKIKRTFDYVSFLKFKESESYETKQDEPINSEEKRDIPKFKRKIQLEDKSEKKIKEIAKEKLDLDVLDYTEMDDFSSHENSSTESIYSTDLNGKVDNNDNAHLNESSNWTYSSSTKPFLFQEHVETQNVITSNRRNETQINNSTQINNKHLEIYDNNAQDNHNDAQNNDDAKNNDNDDQNNDNDTQNKDNEAQSDDKTTDDSGFKSDCVQTYILVKTCLIELSKSFKLLYDFMNTSIREYRSGAVNEERRRQLHERATKSLTILLKNIRLLKRIIQRESEEGALRSLLHGAGDEVAGDKRITRYRQVVTKCLEQAHLLENALNFMMTITNEDFDANSGSMMESVSSNIQYYNIFE